MRSLIITGTGIFLLALSHGGAAAPEDIKGEEEARILKGAGLATDTASLVKFLRARTPTEGDLARLTALVPDLNHRSYRVREKASRELVAAGEPAIPLLKGALKGAELEMRRRAELCINEIEQLAQPTIAEAVIRLLAIRRAEGAAELLLNYLPFADWEALEPAFLEAMATVGLKQDKTERVPLPVVVAAATDTDIRRRCIAAHVLGHATAAHRKPLARLMTDADPTVRYHAGAALIRSRDERGVSTMLALLGEGPMPLAWHAEEVLTQIAGEQIPTTGLDPAANPAARKKWHESWEGWWKAHRTKVDLAKFTFEGATRGITVAAEYDGVGGGGGQTGRVSQFARGGASLHNLDDVTGPIDVRCLPGGRLLIAEHTANRVTERDRQGKILWEKKLASNPISCARLPNGNTFMATYQQILEVNSAGKEVFNYANVNADGMIYYANKLRNGNVLYITSSGKVTELDSKGAQVRSFVVQNHNGGAGYWASVEALPGGKYLIALGGAGKVVETDNTGKVLWEHAVASPCYAMRLANGNTLMSSNQAKRIIEVDRNGKEVGKWTTTGRPFVVRRY